MKKRTSGKEKEDSARGNRKGKIRNMSRKKQAHENQRKRIPVKEI